MAEGRFRPSKHFDERLDEYQVIMPDISMVFARCRSVESYPNVPKYDGTCWRAYGSNVDGTMEIAVGFEAYLRDDGTERIILCTVIRPREK